MPTSTAEATALTWTTALLRAISSATAADPPTTLSRPIVAVSTISPEVRSTTMDTIPLWGTYRVLTGIPQMNPEPEADRSDFRSDPKGLPWFLAVALHFGAHM